MNPTQPGRSIHTATPARVPDHDLLALVGRGSYGEVWLARSLTGTYRGIKVVFRSAFAHERPYDREFQGIQKFEPVSRTHPGLVTILHVGRNVQAGYFYYVMEVADDLASGQQIDPIRYRPRTLSSLMDQHQPVSLAESMRIGVSLSAALGHLHTQGLIHRDIKPANIIFVNNTPKLADIGLVTDIGEKITFVGTEGYLPPEGPGSPTADIYALGKLLYEISTGQDRLEFPALPEGIRQWPHAPHRMRLNEILIKTCDPNPKKRFQTADQLRAVLQSLLRDLAADLRRTDPTAADGPVADTLQLTIILSPDSEIETRLARLLEDKFSAMHHEVFVDEPSTLDLDWARKIEVQIDASNAVIPLLSAASVRSEHVVYALEIAAQTSRHKPRGLKLLPVRVQYPQPLPRGIQVALGSHTAFAWNGPEDDQSLVDKLTRALAGTGEESSSKSVP